MVRYLHCSDPLNDFLDDLFEDVIAEQAIILLREVVRSRSDEQGMLHEGVGKEFGDDDLMEEDIPAMVSYLRCLFIEAKRGKWRLIIFMLHQSFFSHDKTNTQKLPIALY